MRILRAISDLPWWSGLPIFLLGSLIVPYGLFWYIIGLMVSLFGCWIFSKLLPPEEYPEAMWGAMGMLAYLMVMLIPNELTVLDISISTLFLYAVRSALGLFIGFIMFNQGFKR